ncbi:flagellar biosynthetic protein FliR [Chitinibacteraceae bacterium HSL-7]
MTFLISIRLAIAFFYTPFLQTFPVPHIGRLGLLLGLALALAFPLSAGLSVPIGAQELAMAAIGELMVGIFLSLGIRCLFGALDFSGRVVEAQAGLSLATFFNPATGQHESTLGMLFSMSALVFFVTADGHLGLLRAFVATYELAPLGATLSADMSTVLTYFGKSYVFGFSVAAIIVIVLWLIDVSLAVLLKSMPQFNVLFLSFPLKLLLALVLLAVVVPHWSVMLVNMLDAAEKYWYEALVPNV